MDEELQYRLDTLRAACDDVERAATQGRWHTAQTFTRETQEASRELHNTVHRIAEKEA